VALLTSGQTRRLREALAQAVDRVEDEQSPGALNAILGPLAYRATLGGRTCRVVPVYEARRQNGVLLGVHVNALAPDVPFELCVSGRRRLAVGLPRVDLGDPAFERELKVGATDPALANLVVDAGVRDWLRAAFAATARLNRGELQYLVVTRGRVAWFVPVRKVERGLAFRGEPPSPGDLRDAIAFTLALADRIGPTFERVRSEVASRAGSGGLASWAAAQEAAVVGARAAQRRTARLMLVGVAGCLALSLLTIVAVIGVLVATQVKW
jgi:hypothetical protein